MYPKRDLKEGAVVTRFAPSPTGFVHMGSLLTCFIARKVPSDTDGVFYLRIEDTDQKRSVENGVQGIVDDLKAFDIVPDEGVVGEGKEVGKYGPYVQSARKEIYECYAKSLIERGLAYPCFCTPEEIEETRKLQELNKERKKAIALKASEDTGYGYLVDDGSLHLCSCIPDTELNFPNNFYYSLLIYKLAKKYCAKLNVDNTRLDELEAEAEHTYYNTLQTNISKNNNVIRNDTNFG